MVPAALKTAAVKGVGQAVQSGGRLLQFLRGGVGVPQHVQRAVDGIQVVVPRRPGVLRRDVAAGVGELLDPGYEDVLDVAAHGGLHRLAVCAGYGEWKARLLRVVGDRLQCGDVARVQGSGDAVDGAQGPPHGQPGPLAGQILAQGESVARSVGEPRVQQARCLPGICIGLVQLDEPVIPLRVRVSGRAFGQIVQLAQPFVHVVLRRRGETLLVNLLLAQLPFHPRLLHPGHRGIIALPRFDFPSRLLRSPDALRQGVALLAGFMPVLPLGDLCRRWLGPRRVGFWLGVRLGGRVGAFGFRFRFRFRFGAARAGGRVDHVVVMLIAHVV